MILNNINKLITETEQKRLNPYRGLLYGSIGVGALSHLAKRGVLGSNMQNTYKEIDAGISGASKGWDNAQDLYDLKHYIKNDGDYINRFKESAHGAINGFNMGKSYQHLLNQLPPGTEKAVTTAVGFIPLPITKIPYE